jgi:Tol biopolymer transport system component
LVNSAANDAGPAVSKDGLSLYFNSNRAGGVGDNDLYVAQRPTVDAPWGQAINLQNLNTPSIESSPSLSRDGHWMFFNSSRPGGFGDVDLWVSHRKHVHNDFAWETPQNLGPGINTDKFEAGSGYFANEEGGPPQLYFNRGDPSAPGATNATADIYVSELLPDGTFGNARPVTELNSPVVVIVLDDGTVNRVGGDQRPTLRSDGLEIFFFSNRPGSVPQPNGKTPSSDIWTATRRRVTDPWSPPVNLGPIVNTSAGEFNPYLSSDGLTLYFGSSRDGGCGLFDLYMTTRTRLGEDDRDDDEDERESD